MLALSAMQDSFVRAGELPWSAELQSAAASQAEGLQTALRSASQCQTEAEEQRRLLSEELEQLALQRAALQQRVVAAEQGTAASAEALAQEQLRAARVQAALEQRLEQAEESEQEQRELGERRQRAQEQAQRSTKALEARLATALSLGESESEAVAEAGRARHVAERRLLDLEAQLALQQQALQTSRSEALQAQALRLAQQSDAADHAHALQGGEVALARLRTREVALAESKSRCSTLEGEVSSLQLQTSASDAESKHALAQHTAEQQRGRQLVSRVEALQHELCVARKAETVASAAEAHARQQLLDVSSQHQCEQGMQQREVAEAGRRVQGLERKLQQAERQLQQIGHEMSQASDEHVALAERQQCELEQEGGTTTRLQLEKQSLEEALRRSGREAEQMQRSMRAEVEAVIAESVLQLERVRVEHTQQLQHAGHELSQAAIEHDTVHARKQAELERVRAEHALEKQHIEHEMSQTSIQHETVAERQQAEFERVRAEHARQLQDLHAQSSRELDSVRAECEERTRAMRRSLARRTKNRLELEADRSAQVPTPERARAEARSASGLPSLEGELLSYSLENDVRPQPTHGR